MTLNEPLEESAPLARRLAPRLCSVDAASGMSCAWLHGFWQDLRLLGLASAPEHHAEFYRRALLALAAANAPPRVLVSGAADYSMLAHVLAIYRERGLEPLVHVTDRCETALHLNRWYAERVASRIECSRSDALDYGAAQDFDVICTHSFLVQFPPADRVRLVRKWRELLRPGGAVVTVTRIRATAPHEPVGFSTDEARAFAASVRARAEELNTRLQFEPEELERAAARYLRGQRPWPIRSAAEVRDLFERNGFRVDELSSAPRAAGAREQPSGPALPGSGERIQIVATRC